jgi:hypothetical protein
LYALVFSAFHVTFIILSCALMCYTERDTLEVMLTKTGTITPSATKARIAHHEETPEDEPFPAGHVPPKTRRTSATAREEERETRAPGAAHLVRQDAKSGKKKKKSVTEHGNGGAMVPSRHQRDEGGVEML